MKKIDFTDYNQAKKYILENKLNASKSRLQDGVITKFSDEGDALYCVKDNVVYTPDFKVCLGIELESTETDISSIKIEDGTKVIAASAFESLLIKDVLLPKSIEILGDKAFKNSTIQNINLDDVINYGYEVFANTFIKEAVINKNATFKRIEITDTTTHGVFQNCTRLKSLTFGPQSVPKLFCFECVDLENVNFSDNIKEIGEDAFALTYSLKKIDFKTNIDNVGLGKKSKKVKEGLVSKRIKKVIVSPKNLAEFPYGLLRINNAAFLNSGLEQIILPCSIECIGTDAFRNCSELKHINIPVTDRPLYILDFAFAGTAIEELVVPESVNLLGASFAMDCLNLKFLRIEAPIESVPIRAAANCPKLSEIVLSEHITKLDFECFTKTAISRVDDQFKNIKRYFMSCFSDCSKLKFVHILKDVVVDVNAFGRCPNLDVVICESNCLKGNPFKNSNKNLLLIAPSIDKGTFASTNLTPKEINSDNIEKLLEYMSFKEIMKLPVKKEMTETILKSEPTK